MTQQLRPSPASEKIRAQQLWRYLVLRLEPTGAVRTPPGSPWNLALTVALSAIILSKQLSSVVEALSVSYLYLTKAVTFHQNSTDTNSLLLGQEHS